MLNIDFRVDWGYNVIYSRRHYHPTYNWDGHIEASNSESLEISECEYPPSWWAPCHSVIERKLPCCSWKSSTKRKIAGIRVKSKCDKDTVFSLVTNSGTFTFTAQDIIEKKHLIFSVGPKYGFCKVVVFETNYLWFRPLAKENTYTYEALDLPLNNINSQRMTLAELEPNSSFVVPFSNKNISNKASLVECICHLQAMILKPNLPDMQNHVASKMNFEISLDNHKSIKFSHFFRYHGFSNQLLEDIWVRIPLNSQVKNIQITNQNNKYPLYISRLICEEKTTKHLQMTLPKWGLKNDIIIGKIFATHSEKVTISYLDKTLELELQQNWNEFKIVLDCANCSVDVQAKTSTASSSERIEFVYDLTNEYPEVKVGYDMTSIPHDSNGLMDWLLDYTHRTQLGNTVVFRNFGMNIQNPSDTELTRWGKFCKEHKIYVQSVNCHESNALGNAAQDYMHNAGKHEYSYVVYAVNPDNQSNDMKEASERFVEYLKEDVNQVKAQNLLVGYGDASGGHRYAYLAGAQFIRSETLVPHTQMLLSQTRAAAESLGNGDWGVHIAIQHDFQPHFLNEHLAIYLLSLYQAWMMGASVLYEEDSLFHMWKEERQCWDDALTKSKREMTREFFRFVKTHPRQGKAIRSIAFYEGRYAAPFNGFICDSEQTPEYSVWGKFGNDTIPEWGHNQVEKCRHLLDILMPGACVHPLRQKFTERRFFFSGTPFGDFDQVPAEASSKYLNNYKLILNLGWNTMIEEDYLKLKDFVANGGILFSGLPQFSTHTKRDFIKDMDDLSLYNNGDLSELCGVKVIGKGKLFKGNWNCKDREKITIPNLSRLPNNCFDEDTPCHLANIELHGAEVVAWDADSGDVIITKHQFGAGTVYLVNTYAYCGHEILSDIVSAFIAQLSNSVKGKYYVEDNTQEIFWTLYKEDYCIKMMLLNTDWTGKNSNTKVIIHTPIVNFETVVSINEPKILTILDDKIIDAPFQMHIEATQDSYKVHSNKNGVIKIITKSEILMQEVTLPNSYNKIF